jgi:hypothetical protein
MTAIDKHIEKYAPTLDTCQILACENKPAVVVASRTSSAFPRRVRRRRQK